MRDVHKIKTVIIKIGSSSLSGAGIVLRHDVFAALAREVRKLHDRKINVVLVTSGAVAVGRYKLDLKTKPRKLPLQQACAALGQPAIMRAYECAFDAENLLCAQVLVCHDDFENRKRLVNLFNTFEALFEQNVVPIVNENDALAVEEIKMGDNDTLAAMLVSKIQADLLILLSDIDGLYTQNPNLYPDAKLIPFVKSITPEIEAMAGDAKSSVGTGGMRTKIDAARIATNSGGNMVILNANQIDQIEKVVAGHSLGTWFARCDEPLHSRQIWLIYKSSAKGTVRVDDGARRALVEDSKSLLPRGIVQVTGTFMEHSVVFLADKNGNVFGKGIINFSAEMVRRLMGKSTSAITEILGYKIKDEVVHRDDLVITEGKNYGKIK